MADKLFENRLDALEQIDNVTYRSALYRDIRSQTPYVGDEHWFDYTINVGERLYPELIAHRIYSDKALKWVILVVTKLNDYRQPLLDGETITLPSQEWLRDRIKYYRSKLERRDERES